MTTKNNKFSIDLLNNFQIVEGTRPVSYIPKVSL